MLLSIQIMKYILHTYRNADNVRPSVRNHFSCFEQGYENVHHKYTHLSPPCIRQSILFLNMQL